MIGKEISACVTANGSNLNLHWDYLGTDEKDYFDGMFNILILFS